LIYIFPFTQIRTIYVAVDIRECICEIIFAHYRKPYQQKSTSSVTDPLLKKNMFEDGADDGE